MEDSYRNNIIEFSSIYLDKEINYNEDSLEFMELDFTYYVYKQLFDIDINESGYGLDNSTRQMTNNIGDLKIYNENDSKKESYLEDIKKGDLLFFHTQDNDVSSPTPNNHYPGHVGIYLGDKKFIHIDTNREKIIIDNLVDMWLNTLVGSRDIIKGIILKNNYRLI